MATKKVYKYNYPDNRKAFKSITTGERTTIHKIMKQKKMKLSYSYMALVIQGFRTNKAIEELVKDYIERRNDLLKSFK